MNSLATCTIWFGVSLYSSSRCSDIREWLLCSRQKASACAALSYSKTHLQQQIQSTEHPGTVCYPRFTNNIYKGVGYCFSPWKRLLVRKGNCEKCLPWLDSLILALGQGLYCCFNLEVSSLQNKLDFQLLLKNQTWQYWVGAFHRLRLTGSQGAVAHLRKAVALRSPSPSKTGICAFGPLL